MNATEIALFAVLGLAIYIVGAQLRRVTVRIAADLSRLAGKLDRVCNEVVRIRDLEDTDFKRKLSCAAPAPLRRVIGFRFGVGEKFWKEVLQVSPKQYDFVCQSVVFRPPLEGDAASFYASASIELKQWRSHLEFSVSDSHRDFPERHFAVYPWERRERILLWERELPNDERDDEWPSSGPRVQLKWEGSSFRLGVIGGRFGSPAAPGEWARDENVFLEIPTHGDTLDCFKRPDEERDLLAIAEGARPYESEPWYTVYENADETKDLYWELEVRDLQRWADE